jgi:replicative DNA helicase
MQQAGHGHRYNRHLLHHGDFYRAAHADIYEVIVERTAVRGRSPREHETSPR